MKRDVINIIRNQKRLRLTFGQTFFHYFVVLFFLFISIMFFYDAFKKDSESEQINNLIAGIPFLILAIISFILQYRQLILKKISFDYSKEQFNGAVNRTVSELGWVIEHNNKDFFRAHRPWSWTGSWGEIITIVKLKNSLLINSIGDPDTMFSFGSYYWNKRNLKVFLANLNDEINGVTVKSKIEEHYSRNEWSIKAIVIRLLCYPFALFLIVIGVLGIVNPLSYSSVMAGLGLIVAASVYLYADLKIILKKKNNG